MATKISVKAREAYVQYSKRMCTTVSIFWMIYRVVVSMLIFFRPDVSNALVHLTDGADTVMIANISIYTGNSIAEKGFLAFGKRKKLYSSDDENEKEQEVEIKSESYEDDESSNDNG